MDMMVVRVATKPCAIEYSERAVGSRALVGSSCCVRSSGAGYWWVRVSRACVRLAHWHRATGWDVRLVSGSS